MEGVVRWPANYVALSPVSFLERSVKVYRDRTSVVYGSTELTWKQTHLRCVKLASALTRLGVARGDVLLLLISNPPALVTVYLFVASMYTAMKKYFLRGRA